MNLWHFANPNHLLQYHFVVESRRADLYKPICHIRQTDKNQVCKPHHSLLLLVMFHHTNTEKKIGVPRQIRSFFLANRRDNFPHHCSK